VLRAKAERNCRTIFHHGIQRAMDVSPFGS
jgi:hypothetical protein